MNDDEDLFNRGVVPDYSDYYDTNEDGIVPHFSQYSEIRVQGSRFVVIRLKVMNFNLDVPCCSSLSQYSWSSWTSNCDQCTCICQTSETSLVILYSKLKKESAWSCENASTMTEIKLVMSSVKDLSLRKLRKGPFSMSHAKKNAALRNF